MTAQSRRYLAGAIWVGRGSTPVMGVIGAVVIAIWSWSRMRDTANVLLDAHARELEHEIRDLVESPGDARITDLHVWRGGPGAHTAICRSAWPMGTDRSQLSDVHEIVHLNVEQR